MFFLKFLWRRWLPIARAVGNFQAQLILTLFYLLLLLPVAFFVKFFLDPLNLKYKRKSTDFVKWEHPKQNLEEARKQY